MKVLIIIDQEGCKNVTPQQSPTERIQHMKKQLKEFLYTIPSEHEVNILDCHNNGLNVLSLKTQFPKAIFISHLWNFNINRGYDCAVLIGFHSANNADSPFAHTFRNEISETLLNEEAVGEVTLLVKWLQSFHIPVLWVHGEPQLMSEVKKLGIPFISNSCNLNFLNYKAPPLHDVNYRDIYNIKIRLIHDKLLDAFPTQLFSFQNNYIVFKNIHHYLINLSEVSIFLNAARNYFTMYIKRLINYIKWNYTKETLDAFSDEKLHKILTSIDFTSLSREDLEYLESKLVKKI